MKSSRGVLAYLLAIMALIVSVGRLGDITSHRCRRFVLIAGLSLAEHRG